MKRVVIVGGGMGGLAAAFDLVANHPGEYEIAIYERDWRLGGKGASGRNLDPAFGKRIEEHGLHVLMGFYENVFEILHRCYRDLRAANQLPSANGPWWHGVLHALDEIFFSEPPHGGLDTWTHWHVPFPANSKVIGEPAQALPSVRELIVELFKDFVQQVKHRLVTGLAAPAALPHVEALSHIEALSSVGELELLTDTHQKRAMLRAWLERILKAARDTFDITDEKHHRWFVALYFTGLNLIGILDEVLPHEPDFRDTLDKLDYKDWIANYNFLQLDDIYHRESAPVNAVYDLVFSRKLGFAAGSALYDTMLMLFHYKGHIFYKMAGGMGDVVFAPLYLWLKAHGVSFHFFHDLVDVELSTDQQRVERLIFDVTQTAVAGTYDPLISVACTDDDGQSVMLPCWPSTPDGASLQAGPGLVPVTDFDAVVLAIPVGAIREKTAANKVRCAALYVDPEFKAMAEGMVTRCTRAVQLWFSTDLAGLGWKVLPTNPALGPVLGSYRPEAKFNSWADMTQVLPRETWAGGTVPQNIAYLCDVFDEDLVGDPARARVHDDALAWLTHDAGGLWPAMVTPFPWDKLVDPSGGDGPARLAAQYWRANTDGSGQYVLGAPNTTALRLDPHGTQFSNLFLAGDWVKTPLNAGCVEGAAMGGRLAARRIAEHFQAQPPAPKVAATPFTTGSSPAYIPRDGDLPLLQPVVLGDLTMHGYVLKAEHDPLAAVLRKTFEPLGITCKPLLPVVVATSVQASQIRSQARPDDGYMEEAELGFWVPVRMTWDGGSSTGFYLPYLFVDNPAAMLAGREIYGFNKILGQFSYKTKGDIDPAEVKAQVLHTRNSDTRLDWQTVASLVTSAGPKTTEWASSDALIQGIAARLVAEHPEAKLSASFTLPSSPLFFLKQFRAAADGAKTCMQRAVTAHVSLKQGTVSGGWLAHDSVELSFTSHATLDIATTLGLKPTAKPWLAFWAECTATVEAGKAFGGAADAEG